MMTEQLAPPLALALVSVLGTVCGACGDGVDSFRIVRPGPLAEANRTSLGVELSVAWVASDLAPIGRVFAWNAALPAGTYDLDAVVNTPSSSDRVDATSRVIWRPAD